MIGRMIAPAGAGDVALPPGCSEKLRFQMIADN